MKILVVLFAVWQISFTATQAQVEASKPMSLKLLASPQYSVSGEPALEVKSLSLKPAAALAVATKGNNFQEIAVRTLRISEEKLAGGTGTRISTISLGLRYNYNFSLIGTKETKVQPYLGIGVGPYLESLRLEPGVSNAFPRTRRFIGIPAELVARATINITPQLFMEVNIPVRVYDVIVEYQHFDNPSLPLEQQKETTVEGQAFPKLFELNLGLGIRL